jgi:transcriptional regulator with GAF, ATPase, and Fis domain/pSer/pThr/pTyr-binding forkhead associated (FHA) protein
MLSRKMNPRLIAISGNLKGTSFACTNDEISIGREASNSICLNELSVSRRHCVIERDPVSTSEQQLQSSEYGNEGQAVQGYTEEGSVSTCSHFTIFDLESYNGTFVNGVPVKEQRLSDGDQIRVGDVCLLFLLSNQEAMPTEITGEEANLITRSTVRLRGEDALYLHPEKLPADLPTTTRIVRDLSALLKISSALGSIRDLQELYAALFKLILEIIPAEREAILLTDEVQDGFASVRGWNKLLGPDNSIKVSNTITTQVLRERVALLSNDLFATEGLSDAPSLVEASVCSVLCVPLVIFDKSFGVIYLDTSDRTARFDEGHLQLLTAIAYISAAALESAKRFELVVNENERLKKEVNINHKMIGESAAMRAVYQFIGKVAQSDSTILIRGESGTGKELAARAIHMNSARANEPFVAINGATLSETLLESELFGHEKGAFTGAITQKRGKLEVANGGTLFLDEVGELTPMIQAKLLRVLQEQEFERVGGTRQVKVDLRIIAATNRNLEEAVSKGLFRRDLYYRLNVVSLTMPLLKTRDEDVQLLASYFASIYSNKCKRRIQGISSKARALLRAYDWPGNVRELQNVIERAVVLGSSEVITPQDLPETLFEIDNKNVISLTRYHERVKEAKSMIIKAAIEEAGGSYTKAAKQLGLHPANLSRLVRNLNLIVRS